MLVGVSRTPRLQVAGMYHVTSRSIAEERIFRDDGDYNRALALLADVTTSGLCACHQFCFMPTHWHVIATVDDGRLEHAVHRLNRRYASAFNARYGRRGKVFDTPYSSTLIDSEPYLWQVVRYVALNPKDYETWPWASYPALVGLRPPFSFVDPTPLVQAFPGAAAQLRRFVDEGRELAGTNLVGPEPSSRI
jgi:putative transposase